MSPSTIPQQTQDKILGTIRNQFGAAEGSLLPPPQRGSTRVPLVTNLQTLKVTRVYDVATGIISSVQAIISFNEPTTSQNQLDHYNIYAGGVNGNVNQFNVLTTTQSSPATFNITLPNPVPVLVIKVQTVLKNGLISNLNLSPSCTFAL